MAAFTVFAFGTGEKSNKTQNIISQFSSACASEHLIIEGSGILGREVKVNAKKASLSIVEWLSTQNSFNNSLNLTGFSRGSVTCIHIANRLKQFEHYLEQKEGLLNAHQIKLLAKLRGIRIHIFAVDPVAGMFDKNERHARTIPANVKNYVAVLQRDEMRRDFKPQDMTRAIIATPEETLVSMLPMYGNHSDTTKIKKREMQSGAKLTWYAMYQFLSHHGTRFKDNRAPQIIAINSEKGLADLPENPDAKELLRWFALHHKEREHYLLSGQLFNIQDGLPVPRTIRTLNSHLKYYVKNAHFFINQLERELFKVAYPKAFNYLFEKNQMDERFPLHCACSKQDVVEELGRLKQENPDLFTRLNVRGVAQVKQVLFIGEPRGFYCLEPCITLLQIAPHMVPDLVKERVAFLNKLPLLEMEIYRFTFRYQREKAEMNLHGTRAQHALAKEIRNEINYFVNNSPVDRGVKYHFILDRIEKHYRFLVQTNSTSELKDMLQNLLARHGRTFCIHKNSIPNAAIIVLIEALLAVLRESISFVGHLGHVGGAVLNFIGAVIQDFGRRANELLGNLGYNPLKYLASAVAIVLEFTGFAIKHSFGLKVLTYLITKGINSIKNALVLAINSTNVERTNNTVIESPIEAQGQEVNKAMNFMQPQHVQTQTHTLPTPHTVDASALATSTFINA